MRKRYKLKLRSCGLCKPHKRGLEHRWNAKELQLAELTEQEMQLAVRHEQQDVLDISAPGNFEQHMPASVSWFKEHPPGRTDS